MPGIWANAGPLEAGAIINHVREHRGQSQVMRVRTKTSEAVAMAVHYCSRLTARQIIERRVRPPLYDALMNIGPTMAMAMEAPLLDWEDGDMAVPVTHLKPHVSVADAYRRYIERHCGYTAAEENIDLLKRLATSSLDAEALQRRVDTLELFSGHPAVMDLLAREHSFQFDFPSEADNTAE